MIVRLKVKGFKNLRDVEVFFGPFTCIAGPNGIGKSNLFDSIRFLSALANKDNTLVEAAFQVRDEKNRKKSVLDIRNLFYHDGKKYTDTIEFSVDMIVPSTGIDHLGQQAEATTTALSYNLKLSYRNNSDISQSILEIRKEELVPLRKTEFRTLLKKMDYSPEWISSVLLGSRRNATPFIKTDEKSGLVFISADQIKGNKKTLKVATLPRTILSTANAVENPTMLMAKKELESWKILQLEPSAMRSPDDIVFTETPQISSNGEHLPATLFRLENDKNIKFDVKGRITNRLSEFIDDIFKIHIEKDERKDILSLLVKNRAGTIMPAKSLSDGTLRFIALSVIEVDPIMQGLLCMEEPENGIHPARIPAMIRLLSDIASDVSSIAEHDNPLRQVMINTHSPLVVAEVPEDSVLFADFELTGGATSVVFRPLSDTWRAKLPSHESPAIKARLLEYLNPYIISAQKRAQKKKATKRRVIERPEMHQLSIFST